MLVCERTSSPAGTPAARIVLDHAERARVRWRTVADTGEDVGIALPRGTVLVDGDLLEAQDGRLVLVVAADEDLLEVTAHDPERLARAAYHLGNRHAVVEIGAGFVRTPRDPVLETMLRRQGLEVRTVRAPFRPEPGAYAAGGHAHSGEARHAGVIHDFLRARERS